MPDIQLFNFDSQSIRTLEIDGEPWFVGKDIASVLGYSDTSQAIRNNVDEEDKLTRSLNNSGQARETILINESGMYGLILSSKLETAKRFKKWVTSEVLPTIRKTGAYVAPTSNNDQLAVLVNVIKDMQSSIQEQQSQMKQLAERTNKLDVVEEELKETKGELVIKSTELKDIQKSGDRNPGCMSVINNTDLELANFHNGFIIEDYLTAKNLQDWALINTFKRRAASAKRFGKRLEDLPKVNGKLIYFLTDIPYLDELAQQLLHI